MRELRHWSTFSGASSGLVCGLGFALALLLAFGCGSNLPKIPTYAEAEKQARQEFSAHVPAESQLSIDGGVASVPKEVAVPKGAETPRAGVFMTPERYAIYKTVKIDRELLIKKYEAEAIAARAKAIILDASTKALKDAATRNWWEKNSLLIGTITGFVLGVALTVGLVYGLTNGEGVK